MEGGFLRLSVADSGVIRYRYGNCLESVLSFKDRQEGSWCKGWGTMRILEEWSRKERKGNLKIAKDGVHFTRLGDIRPPPETEAGQAEYCTLRKSNDDASVLQQDEITANNVTVTYIGNGSG